MVLSQSLKIALVPLVRSTFDVEEGKRVYQREMNALKKIRHVRWITPSQVIEYPESLINFIRTMRREAVDGIIVMSATFHLGEIALSLASEFPEIPILCWAVPEPPYAGNRVRLNSLVGAHLDVSNLYKSGRDKVSFIYGSSNEERFRRELVTWLDVLRVLSNWRGAKIALVGGHAKTFIDVDIYEPHLFSEFGITVEHLPLEVVFNFEPPETLVEETKKEYRKLYSGDSGMNEEKLEKVAKLAATFSEITETAGYAALAIRCWPEFAAVYGVSPCAAMSYNMAKGTVILACEGDIGGTLTMQAFKSVGCNEIYLADVSQIFEDESAVLLWHCGVAPHNLWDRKSEKMLETYFAGGKGVTVGFVLKPGPVTIARIDYIRGLWHLFLAKGEAIPTEQELKGTYVKVRVRNPLGFVKTLVNSGFAHHVVMAYGDYFELFQNLAELKGWKVHEPESGSGRNG